MRKRELKVFLLSSASILYSYSLLILRYFEKKLTVEECLISLLLCCVLLIVIFYFFLKLYSEVVS